MTKAESVTLSARFSSLALYLYHLYLRYKPYSPRKSKNLSKS